MNYMALIQKGGQVRIGVHASNKKMDSIALIRFVLFFTQRSINRNSVSAFLLTMHTHPPLRVVMPLMH
jgi:hypothetical protein